MQICSELLIEKMFYYKFFCQTIQCPQQEGGRIPPPSDVLPTEKHADVTRVNCFLNQPHHSKGMELELSNYFHYFIPEAIQMLSHFCCVLQNVPTFLQIPEINLFSDI